MARTHTVFTRCSDFAPTTACGGPIDGSPLSQEVYLLTGYPDLSPATERQYLRDFRGGVWWSYTVVGNIRVRISTIRGGSECLGLRGPLPSLSALRARAACTNRLPLAPRPPPPPPQWRCSQP